MPERKDSREIAVLKEKFRNKQRDENKRRASVLVEHGYISKKTTKEIFRYLHTEVINGFKRIKQNYGDMILPVLGSIELPSSVEKDLENFQDAVIERELTEKHGDLLPQEIIARDEEEDEDEIEEWVKADKQLHQLGEKQFLNNLMYEEELTRLRTEALVAHRTLKDRTVEYYAKQFCAALARELEECDLEVPETVRLLATEEHARSQQAASRRKLRGYMEGGKRLGISEDKLAQKTVDDPVKQALKEVLTKFLRQYPDPRVFMYELLGQKPPRRPSA